MQQVVVFGILLGLSAAVWQACSYFASRAFLVHTHPGSLVLFGLAHFHMGVFAVLLLPLVRSRLGGEVLPFSNYALPLIFTTVTYLTGQFLLFTALRRMDSSRVAPLLGLKMPILVFLSFVLYGESISVMAVCAVLLCTVGALAISPPTSLPRLGELALMIATCTAYCLSDLNIPRLVNGLSESPTLWHVLYGVCLSYVISGVVGALICLRIKAFAVPRAWQHALPYACFWFLGIACLFGCFTLVGPIFGNMLQSTRSLIVVLVAPVVIQFTDLKIETISGWNIFFRRLAAALVITVAIILYYAGG